ncbi:hypothetical protein V501_08158 [Pseudogymnoascus sp. VKM F-4519 (FW-2642)]|nr:hypothetical protein V501_08158 [Pseudogymnoascus sp. VKM F-4519 (FW-2642)]
MRYHNPERSPPFNVTHATIASPNYNYLPPSPAHSLNCTVDDSPINDRMTNANTRPNGRPSTESEDEHWQARDQPRGSRSRQPSNAHTQVRHRASRAGTRSVNRLSAAQLSRKRANDREAQRAIRQRTKDQIETLQEQVKQLTDPEKERRTWNVHLRNRQLEDEVATLHERISAMEMRNTGAMDAGAPLGDPMGGPNRDLRPHDLNMQWPGMDMAYGGAHGLPPGFDGAGMVLSRADTPAGTESPAASFTDMDPASRIDFVGGAGGGGGDDLGIGSDLASPQSWTTVTSPFDLEDGSIFSPQPSAYMSPSGMPFAFQGQPGQAGQQLAPTSAPSNIPSRTTYNLGTAPSAPQQQQQQHAQTPLQSPQPLQPAPPQQMFQPTPQRPLSQVPVRPSPHQQPPPWTLIPRLLTPTTPLDALLHHALTAHRACLSAASTDPPKPIYTDLYPSPPAHPPLPPLSAALTRAVHAAGLRTPATSAAVLSIAHAVARWMARPTEGTYAGVPAWMRPSPRELGGLPAWAAMMVPFARVRESAAAGGEGLLRDWLTGVEFEWVGEVWDGKGGVVEGFENAVKDIGRWKVGGRVGEMLKESGGDVKREFLF